LKVFVNYELRATLFSYLKGIEVLAPEGLRKDLIKDLNIGLKKYL
jgi:predicted DNA-binding transcriptional regulator YafY